MKEIIDEESDHFESSPEVEKTEPKNEIEYMFDQCAKRDFVVRRGRNNRVMVRSIHHNVFNDNLWWAHEQDVFTRGKDMLYEEFRMN